MTSLHCGYAKSVSKKLTSISLHRVVLNVKDRIDTKSMSKRITFKRAMVDHSFTIKTLKRHIKSWMTTALPSNILSKVTFTTLNTGSKLKDTLCQFMNLNLFDIW